MYVTGLCHPASAQPKPGEAAQYNLTVNGKDHFIAFQGNSVTVDGNVYQVSMAAADGSAPAQPAAAAAPASSGEKTPVNAQMPGVVLKVLVSNGDQVKKGDQLLILEAMKMEVPVAAPKAGTVTDITVEQGAQVANNQQLLSIA